MILCPAAGPTEDAVLFGLIDRRGQVTFGRKAIPVTRQLLLQLPVEADRQFRFASACAGGGCIHWSDGCSLSARLSEFQAFRQDGGEDGLPDCAIRTQCRWYIQDGPQMCSNCQIHSRLPHSS